MIRDKLKIIIIIKAVVKNESSVGLVEPQYKIRKDGAVAHLAFPKFATHPLKY